MLPADQPGKFGNPCGVQRAPTARVAAQHEVTLRLLGGTQRLPPSETLPDSGLPRRMDARNQVGSGACVSGDGHLIVLAGVDEGRANTAM